MPNGNAQLFKGATTELKLADDLTVKLVFDLNAFCELETIYDSVDTLIQTILNGNDGTNAEALLTQVKCGDQFIEGSEVTIAGTPLIDYLRKVHIRSAKHADTLNLLWAATLHENAEYNEHDELVGYKLSKRKLGSYVTFANLREVNQMLIMALLRDLIPVKNAEEPEEETPATKPRLAPLE